MEETDVELPPVKKLKLAVEEGSMEEEETVVVEVENRSQVSNFKSPITEPVLTPEIWDQIFRDFTGNHFISVLNATPEWNQLLGSRKTTELFSKLIHKVLPYLDFHDILACRQVQRGSKVAVDKFLENSSTSSEQAFSFQHDGYPIVLSEIEKISDNYALSTRPEVDKFSRAHSLRKMPSTYNPFITRTFCVDIEIPEDEEETERLASDHARMNKFLSRYGTHIWRFNINLFQLFNGVAKLIAYLHRQPHLKILEISGIAVRDMRFFRNKEFPALEHLEHLEVTDFRAHSITSRIIQRYGAQLTTLVVPGSWIKFQKIEKSDFKVLLPKLKRLRIVDADASTLGKLAGVEWPVEILHIRLDTSLTLNENKRELLLQAVSNFQSLSHLELFFEQPALKYIDRGSRIEDSLLEFVTEGEDLASLEEDSLAIAEGALEQSTKLQKVGIAWESTDTVFVKTRSKVQ